MSLLVSMTFKHFAVIASDGLAVKVENGAVVPLTSDYCKFSVVGNGDIAVASTGSLLLNRKLVQFAKSFAEQHRDDQKLFSLLAKAVPDEVRNLNTWAKAELAARKLSHAVEYIDDGEIGRASCRERV